MINIKSFIRFSIILCFISVFLFFSISCQSENSVVNVNEDITVVEESTPEGQPVHGGTIKIAFPVDTENVNPLLTNNEDIVNFLGLVYETPLYVDNSGSFIPVLIDSWEVDETGKIYTFYFRKGIQFHDGHELKSDDVIATINQIYNNTGEDVIAGDSSSFDIDSESDQANQADNDAGVSDETNVSDVQSRYSKYNSLIENVSRIDDYTIRITMKKPGREALYFMCFPVLPENYVSNQFNGTGPYKYKQTLENGGISLVSNDNWWKTEPYIKSIEVIPIENLNQKLDYIKNGDLDFMTTRSIASSKYKSESVNVSDYETYYYDCLVPNLFKESMKDINIRKAISYGIDRRQIISTVLLNHGVSTEMPVSPNFSAYNIKYKKYEYDEVAASELLETSGYDAFINEEYPTNNLTINLIVPNEIGFEYRLEVARIIADNLLEIGIICNVEQLSPNDYIERLENNNYDIAYCSYYMGPDPDITNLLGTGKELNYGNVASQELDAILASCSNAVSDEEVTQSYDELQQYLTDKVPQVGLFYRRFSALYNNEINDVIIDHENSAFFNVNNWYKTN